MLRKLENPLLAVVQGADDRISVSNLLNMGDEDIKECKTTQNMNDLVMQDVAQRENVDITKFQ